MAQVAQSSTSSDTSGTKSKIGTIGTTATFTGTTDPGRAISIALSRPKPKGLLGAPGGPRLLSFADGAHGGAAFFYSPVAHDQYPSCLFYWAPTAC